MASFQLEPRELEILRTLARLHFMTAWEIAEVFFSQECTVKARLRRLASRGLIRRHALGVPASFRYSAWRLSATGIKAVLDEFPDEAIAADLDERLARKGLVHLEHRRSISRVYLDLLRGGAGELLEDSSTCTVAGWIDMLRKRAAQVRWQADGEVVIQFEDASGRVQLVPDATVVSPAKRVRLFIELDRSNKGLSRIEEHLGRYASFLRTEYSRHYRDCLTPWVVFVVKSEGRRQGIARLMERILGRAGQCLVGDQDATPWLSSVLLRDEDAEWMAANGYNTVDPNAAQ